MHLRIAWPLKQQTARRSIIEKLWRDFFADPSRWWDNRAEKTNPRYPDFKHKITKESLWLDGELKPPWVEEQLAAMEPGTLQVDHYTWNKRLAKLAKAGQYKQTMQLFQEMQRQGLTPDKFTFVPVLNACSSLGALEEGRRIHAQVINCGCETDVYVDNCLVDMYAKCGSIEEACKVFSKMPTRDVISWNAMILGYVKCGQGQEALEQYREMQRVSVDPDYVTFLGVLNACASAAALEEGRHVHEQIIQRGYASDIVVCSCLVDMYAKCGSINDAQSVFNKMPTHDVVAWSTMILGYVKCGDGQKALDLYSQMQQEGVNPDPGTFVGVLNACASVAALEEGQRVHQQILVRRFQSDLFVGNSLIDMYSKCGSIEDARRVFNAMPRRDVVSWTAMLRGYAMHGHCKEALIHFERLYEERLKMNELSFVSLLSACNHGGLVEEGQHYFRSMSTIYNTSPTMEHYACIVDLLGRAGRLHEAEELINTMTFEPDAPVWKSLLGACRIHGNMEMAESVANKLLELDPENAAGYVLLANIYAAAGEWDSNAIIQRDRLHNGCEENTILVLDQGRQ